MGCVIESLSDFVGQATRCGCVLTRMRVHISDQKASTLFLQFVSKLSSGGPGSGSLSRLSDEGMLWRLGFSPVFVSHGSQLSPH